MTDFEYCIILLPGGGDPIMADIVQPNLVKVGKTLRWAKFKQSQFKAC